jgi:enterochelin esterase-like enzyme
MKELLARIFKINKKIKSEHKTLFAQALQRDVLIEVLLPPNYKNTKQYPLIIFNDGQDFPALEMNKTLNDLYKQKLISEAIVVGVHCNDNRINEYGTAGIPDYANRGNKASEYTQFIIKELLPFLRKQYAISKDKKDISIAGFSLGGLSAFDIAWHHAEVFARVGVFSGALWWRSEAFHQDHPDGHRIVHEMVAQCEKRDGLRFWFQTGTLDETSDRNNNGIIDSIDDTLDLIACLREKQYAEQDLTYVEIEDGEHNPQTWGKAMLAFLLWAL